MFRGIVFRDEVEDLVQFVEETDPSEIIERTLDKLRAGTPAVDLLRAGALAVCRSTELPPEHHGGPVHPICGIHGVYNTSRRLSGEMAFMPIVQHVALCNNHVHSPQMGPYIMPAMDALEGTGAMIGSYHLSEGTEASDDPDIMGSTEDALLRAIQVRKPSLAEQYYLWLEENRIPGETLDLLLPACVSRNSIDDHYFVYPMFTFRALDVIGWEWAPVLMRVVVRYQARNPFSLSRTEASVFDDVTRLIEDYSLMDREIPLRTGDRETEAIGRLGEAIGRCTNYLDGMEPIAKALSEGMSLEGAGEALSVGASMAYLKSSYGNPMDSHLHTGTNGRRYLLNVEGVSLRHKIEALITALTGPECLNGSRMLWEKPFDPAKSVSLPEMGQAELLDGILESIERQPWANWREIGVDNLELGNEVQEAMLLAQRYADRRYDPEALFRRIGAIISRDDFTELHGIKHHQALVDEFYATREPYRWNHLVAAVKSVAVVEGGKESTIFDRTLDMLKV